MKINKQRKKPRKAADMLSPDEADILNAVGCWKVIWVNDLYKAMMVPVGYHAFRKTIRVLESKGYLSGRDIKRAGKYVYLTEKGALRSSTGDMPDGPALEHDLVCSKVILKLLEFESFTSGSVSDGPDSELCPDGVIRAAKNGRPYTLAIEVELSQKSQFRVQMKFADYAKEKSHTYALYITNSKSLYETYRATLLEMNHNIQRHIILSLAYEMTAKQYDYRRAVYWHKEKKHSFDSLFGESKNHV